MTSENDIWTLIDRSNDAWLSGDPYDTAELFADEARLVAPALTATIDGRAAIVQTYVDMVTSTTVERFDVTDRSLHLDGDTAIASYVYGIEYELSGERHEERGQEILVLREGATGWRAIWRTQVRLPHGR